MSVAVLFSIHIREKSLGFSIYEGKIISFSRGQHVRYVWYWTVFWYFLSMCSSSFSQQTYLFRKTLTVYLCDCWRLYCLVKESKMVLIHFVACIFFPLTLSPFYTFWFPFIPLYLSLPLPLSPVSQKISGRVRFSFNWKSMCEHNIYIHMHEIEKSIALDNRTHCGA